MNFKKRLFLAIGVVLFILATGANAFALESGISLSSPGPFKVNDTFTVQIKVTGNQNFLALEGRISFSKDKLSVISAAWNPNPLYQLDMQSLDDPATANSNGVFSFNAFTMSISGIDPNIYGNPLLTITVKCISEGIASIGNNSRWITESCEGYYTPQTLTIANASKDIIGDFDKSGRIELQDAILGLQVTAGLRTAAAIGYAGNIGLGDVIYILRVLVGISASGGTPDIVLLIATDIGKIKIAWLPVSSSSTTAANMSYEVHLSKDANFTPSASTLKTSVIGQAQADISGLETGTIYYVVIVADDGNGNKSQSKTGKVKTLSKPVIVNNAVQFNKDSDLGLQNIGQNGTIYSFAGANPPPAGSFLFAKVGEDTVFRKVTSVNTTSAGIDVQTADASLSEVLSQAAISTNLTLFDTNQASQQSSILTRRSVRSDGSRQTVMRWKDDLLTAEHIDNAGTTDDTSVSPGSGDNQYNIRVKREGGEVEVKATITFTPELSTDLSWEVGMSGITITGGEIKAKGTISAEIDASYNFSASKSLEKEIDFPLFTKKYRSLYYMPPGPGGVPVYQETTFTLKAVLSANAETSVEANANAKAAAALEFGTRYDPASRSWIPIPPTPSFEKSCTLTANAQGSVSGEIRLIPNIEVRFYKVVAGNLSVEPFIRTEIAAEAIANADLIEGWGYAKMQFNQIDLYLQAETYVSATMDVFFKQITLLEKTKVYASSEWFLFSLPKLELASSDANPAVGKAVTLTAKVIDGANNPFDDSSIKWQVTPSNGQLSPSGRTATFSADKEGTYTIFFSGVSKLKDPLGRQFAFTTITVGAGECTQGGTNSLGMTFVSIPAGTFMIGSPPNEPGRDEVEFQHQVTLTKSFCMQTTEVTQGQWKAVMGSNPSECPARGDNFPVDTVSYYDAQAFIAELNKRGEGTYRLPTEAEWEYAARAGSTTAFPNGGITYLYGCKELWDGNHPVDEPVDPNLNAIGWYCGNSILSYSYGVDPCGIYGYGSHPVAQKQANAWGLYDMHGNVDEWT